MQWEATLITHRGESRIAVRFERKHEIIERFKQLPGRRWSQTLRVWHLPDNSIYRQRFKLMPKSIVNDSLAKINPVNQSAFQQFIDEIKLKGYSANTLRTYMNEFAQLLYILKATPVESLNSDRLRSYFLYCKERLKMSENGLHSRMNAIKFYFEKVEKRDKLFFDIPRPKKHLMLPKVLNFEEVSAIIHATENVKHYLLLSLCYGMGLRVSEIVSIKCQDIDTKRMTVFIARAKGKKDRYVNLPQGLIPIMSKYYADYKPKTYLFEGQFGEAYTTRSAQMVFHYCKNKAAVIKKVGIHSLRHSFATHTHEMGTDIHLIQKLLGHNNIKTTLIYTHVSQRAIEKVESPLDRMIKLTFGKSKT